MIADDWTKVRKSQEKMTMIARAQTARIIIIFGYCFMISGWIVTVILPMFGHSVRYLTNITDPGGPLPVQTYYIYDVTKSPQYEITFILQAITMFLCIMPYTGIDNFLSLLIFHISGQLDILNNRLVNLSMNDIANYDDNLKSCMKDHTRLLRYFFFATFQSYSYRKKYKHLYILKKHCKKILFRRLIIISTIYTN